MEIIYSAEMKTQFICQSCGYTSPKWIGRCPECNEWNTFVEEIIKEKKEKEKKIIKSFHSPVSIQEINIKKEERLATNFKELDRVLGGGIVKGSLILVGGEPGIGKSTLLLQVANYLSNNYGKVLYVSGEETLEQIKIRADRLNSNSSNLYIFSENDLEAIEEEINELNPILVVIDSIQTIYSEELTSIQGSISQIRNCTGKLMKIGKEKNISIFLIGHVTKEGIIAGPRVLEHAVDTVLYFEGDKNSQFRILRSYKNRFGSTNEIAVFDMKENGLVEISNPSEIFLSEKKEDVPGCVITSTIEGTRALLVEIQALTTPSYFGMPQRRAYGVDYNRMLLLIAVAEKVLRISLSNTDVFINVVGGIKLSEPAIDLGIFLSIVSSFKDKPLPSKTVVIGEIGLSGEIRSVSQIEKRIKEAEKQGFKRCIIPDSRIDGTYKISINKIRNVKEAINVMG